MLDCGTRAIRQVPFRPADAGAVTLIINTGVEHALVSGEYAARRAECEQAARQLGVSSLGSLTTRGHSKAEADSLLRTLTDPVLRRRARHVLTDDARVEAIAGALTANASSDVYRFIGELLTEAHVSLRDDFEVSWDEADVTVEVAIAAGALGARMIGGGFGGSVLALVPIDALAAVRAAITREFARHSWDYPEFIDAVPSPAARKLA